MGVKSAVYVSAKVAVADARSESVAVVVCVADAVSEAVTGIEAVVDTSSDDVAERDADSVTDWASVAVSVDTTVFEAVAVEEVEMLGEVVAARDAVSLAPSETVAV